MKIQIKECKAFGDGGSHITMSIEDIGKKFLILPESSKYLLEEILKKYHESLKDLTNPLLSEFLTKRDFNIIKTIYKKTIKKVGGFMAGVHKKFLESSYKDLDKFRVSDISNIFRDIENSLPKDIKKKLMNEYYKKYESNK